jgi:hypothetical protein
VLTVVRASLVVVALGAVVSCTRPEPPTDEPAFAVALPATARRETLTAASFDTMVRLGSPIRPPSSDDGRARIVTYVEVPRGAAIDADDGSLASLRLPVGSYSARVEYLAPAGTAVDAAPSREWRILDVRATRFTASGELYAVARPLGRANAGHGWVEWPKAAQARGTEALVSLARAGTFGGGNDRERTRIADKLGAINDCPSCHGARLAANDEPHALVSRGTDASGLYTVAALFRDDGPFETYRPRDPNEGDPHVVARCGKEPVSSSRAPCPDGTRPHGYLDVRAGVAKRDPHVLDVCASRRALVLQMSPRARALVAEAVAACAE